MLLIFLHVDGPTLERRGGGGGLVRRQRSGLITEGLIFHGAFNRNTKKCFETSYSNADQNASLIFTVFLFMFFFFFFFNFKTS